uniref:ATP synthase F0 subunit 8 n=1 Tax=Chaleponcus netus TaxID=2931671 RepID=A0A8T9JBJ2_9MYRI|nr:ATP synthase F0 subunit 8 [Chaleponcus netus]UOF70325.1 ATP synthase F0 subunit 8 [Chaleponcus netus]
MPQMFPMNWTFMMLMFSLILILTAILIYFSFSLNPLIQTKTSQKVMNNWLW